MRLSGPGWRSKPPYGWPIDRAHPLANGLAGCFAFNERTPAVAWDAIAGASAPGAGGVSTSAGPYGPALAFDGSTGYLGPFGTAASYSFVQNTLVFTLAARIRLSSTTARSTILSTVNPATANKGFWFAYETLNTSVGSQALRMFVIKGTSGTTAIDAHSPNGGITDTTGWHHVAVTGGGAGNTLAFYIDGVAVAASYNASFSSLSSGDSSNPTLIGSANTTVDRPFNGSIDHVMAWNRTLSAAEVAELAREPWQVFRAPSARLAVSLSSYPASMAKTLAPSAFAGSAGSAASAAMAKTLATATFAGSATFVASASMAKTLGAAAFAGSAAFVATAAMGVTLSAGTLAGSAGSAGSAAMGVTLGPATFAGASTFTASASMAAILSPGTFAGAATATASASMSATLGAAAFAGSATAGSAGSVSASMAVTLAPAGLAGSALQVFVGTDVLAAIYAWWQAHADIQLATSDRRLWHSEAPPNVVLPYSTFFLVREVAEAWTTAYPLMRAGVQVNCHASTDVEARAAAGAIRDALRMAPLVVDGTKVMHVLPDGAGMEKGKEMGPEGEDIWIAWQSFDIAWTPDP